MASLRNAAVEMITAALGKDLSPLQIVLDMEEDLDGNFIFNKTNRSLDLDSHVEEYLNVLRDSLVIANSGRKYNVQQEIVDTLSQTHMFELHTEK